MIINEVMGIVSDARQLVVMVIKLVIMAVTMVIVLVIHFTVSGNGDDDYGDDTMVLKCPVGLLMFEVKLQL